MPTRTRQRIMGHHMFGSQLASADKDKPTSDGTAPLFAASVIGDLAVVRCLIEKGTSTGQIRMA